MAPIFSKLWGGSYLLYTDEDMQNEMLAVSDNDMKVAKAARMYGNPWKTPANKIAGKHSKSWGKPKTLTEEEEAILVYYIEYMDRQCFPVTTD